MREHRTRSHLGEGAHQAALTLLILALPSALNHDAEDTESQPGFTD
jgi:hypothetical protein